MSLVVEFKLPKWGSSVAIKVGKSSARLFKTEKRNKKNIYLMIYKVCFKYSNKHQLNNAVIKTVIAPTIMQNFTLRSTKMIEFASVKNAKTQSRLLRHTIHPVGKKSFVFGLLVQWNHWIKGSIRYLVNRCLDSKLF